MIYLLAGASLVILGWTVRGAWERTHSISARCSCGRSIRLQGEEGLFADLRRLFLEDHDGPGHEVA